MCKHFDSSAGWGGGLISNSLCAVAAIIAVCYVVLMYCFLVVMASAIQSKLSILSLDNRLAIINESIKDKFCR